MQSISAILQDHELLDRVSEILQHQPMTPAEKYSIFYRTSLYFRLKHGYEVQCIPTTIGTGYLDNMNELVAMANLGTYDQLILSPVLYDPNRHHAPNHMFIKHHPDRWFDFFILGKEDSYEWTSKDQPQTTQ